MSNMRFVPCKQCHILTKVGRRLKYFSFHYCYVPLLLSIHIIELQERYIVDMFSRNLKFNRWTVYVNRYSIKFWWKKNILTSAIRLKVKHIVRSFKFIVIHTCIHWKFFMSAILPPLFTTWISALPSAIHYFNFLLGRDVILLYPRFTSDWAVNRGLRERWDCYCYWSVYILVNLAMYRSYLCKWSDRWISFITSPFTRSLIQL